MSNQDIVANMARVWETIMTLCVPSPEHEWQTPTDGPAWSVQDQGAHMLGSELRLLGCAASEPTPRDTSWSGEYA
jgi:Mycothiol maleylpyruvate isomerase N-terminal domain